MGNVPKDTASGTKGVSNPVDIIGKIALGTIAVAALAIKAISGK